VSRPQVIDDEQHEQVHERVAAIDVAKDSGMVCTRAPHPSRARRPAQHGVDGEGPDERGPRAGAPAAQGRQGRSGRIGGVSRSLADGGLA
jgi:hypothetical protein